MAWIWVNCTNEDYWVPGNGFSWNGVAWVTNSDGLQPSTLLEKPNTYDPYSYSYLPTGSPLALKTARSIRITYSLYNPPNDYNTSITVVTSSGVNSNNTAGNSASNLCTFNFDSIVNERVVEIRFYSFGYYYEEGAITNIEMEVLDNNPISVWTSFVGTKEIVQ